MNAEIPNVVEKSIKYLTDKNGIFLKIHWNFTEYLLANQIQGIFRLSGSSAVVQQLRKDFDKGDSPSLDAVEDAHVIAGLLKLYISFS